MAKRVSMKGRGADIFFGDYTPTPPIDGPEAPEAPEATEVAATAEQVAGMDQVGATAQADAIGTTEPATPDPPTASSSSPPGDAGADGRTGDQARTRASEHASMQEDGATGAAAAPAAPSRRPLPPGMLDAIGDRVADRATVTNAFRYTDQELGWLTDVLYALNKRLRVKLSKQDVARLGLNAVLWDYQAHGDESLLASFARQKQRQRGGGS